MMANRILAPDVVGSLGEGPEQFGPIGDEGLCDALATYHENIRRDDETLPLLLKDPRAMLSLHWWLERDRLCGDRSHVVVTVRNPLDVAASLWQFRLRFNKEPLDANAALKHYSTFWHQLHSTLANYQIVPCYVCYEMLMRDPVRGVAQVCRYLRVQPESLDFSVIDAGLWHERGTQR